MPHAPSKPTSQKLSRSQSTSKTREAIIEAAIGVFAERGIEGARMQSIARRAKVGASTIYGHFNNKHALFEAIIQRAGEQFISSTLKHVADSKSAKERDLRIIERAVIFAESHPNIFKMIMQSGKTERGSKNLLVSMLINVRKIEYDDGIANGIFWPNIHKRLTAVFEISAGLSVVEWWLLNPNLATRNEVIESIVNLRRFGIEKPGPDGQDFVNIEDISQPAEPNEFLGFKI